MLDCKTETNTWKHYSLPSNISALEGVARCTETTMGVITEMQGPETPQSIVKWSCRRRGKVAAKGARILCSIGHHGAIKYTSLYVVYTLGNWWFIDLNRYKSVFCNKKYDFYLVKNKKNVVIF